MCASIILPAGLLAGCWQLLAGWLGLLAISNKQSVICKQCVSISMDSSH